MLCFLASCNYVPVEKEEKRIILLKNSIIIIIKYHLLGGLFNFLLCCRLSNGQVYFIHNLSSKPQKVKNFKHDE